ncbi:MAG TPA: thiolase family protein [Thermoplasmata archaeon]|nr:thiolase family protein [Thermoplasmata archaeon]
MSAHVASVGIGRFGKRSEGLVELAAEAGALALEGVGRKPIDLLVVGSMLSHGASGREPLLPRLASRLSLEAASGLRAESTSATGAMAFHTAYDALETGRYERALVVAVEKMTDASTPEVTAELASALHPEEVRHGATMPALAALVTQRYLERHELPLSAIDRPSVHARAMAARNPNAMFQTPVTDTDVAASRMVASPLRLLHCSAIADGAVGVVLERGTGPATVLGTGQGFESMRIVDRPDLTSFAATRIAAQRAYEAAGITRKELGVVEVHDAFAPFPLIHLEDLGICGPGEGAQWYDRGWVSLDGRLPVNPSGGLIGRGHPIAASSLAGIAEVAAQLRGEAGRHATASLPKIGLAHAVGGLASHNFVTILGGAAP